ncbi:MAG TPA: aquaporin family protein [Alphaproteobacteria bacterium]|nr:aquaporin family protein [Alphaproteobacteria bacterium]
MGSLLLLATVVGSGIMGERLSGGNVAVALLGNTIATGAMLVALILTLGPASGAHLNPAVSLAAGLRGQMGWRAVGAYVVAQIAGAAAGALLAHAMFDLPLLQVSRVARAGYGQMLSEAVATFGLVLTIAGTSAAPRAVAAIAIGLYIAAAYWFTASTSFANPAVTIARMLTDTFAGIRPADVPGFIVAQLVGMSAALGAAHLLWLRRR